MNVTFHTPGGIEGESMRIIQQELDGMGITLDPDCADVGRSINVLIFIMRIIH